ncbi:DMT family transporter [Mycobacterium sp. 21AC1]|uniref:DMT family transporter n=1 Tax=[Mycobacterium] appelbergii TaxID=2939269 RepID=UPI0029393655|nr:DMT family transporter [Mycobacterium sp. 21AC1]MDV3128556.1 DMT family transporter [Mycobacterium sp. 21AC1]
MDAPWTALRAPELAMSAGALAVSASAIFIDLSGASPGTASFYRCVLALPVLAWLALRERRRDARRPPRLILLASVAGACFAGDMLLWTQAILEVGAGLSTVLVNAQVVIVPLLALVIDHEPVHRRYLICLPWLILGVVLTGGVLEHGVSGSDPVWGTVHAIGAAACYSGFLYLLRRAGRHGPVLQSYSLVIVAASIVSLLAGALWHGVDMTPGWVTMGWLALTALFGQVLGWLLVARATPRLSSDVGSALLMLTPVGALVLGVIVLAERPSGLQLSGALVMLISAYAATTEPKWLRGLIRRHRS